MKRILSFAIVPFIVGLVAVSVVQSAGIDFSLDTVPKGFKGDDVIGVVKALSKSYSATIKGTHKLMYGPYDKKDTDRFYAFKLADDKIFATPTELRLEPFISSSWGLVGPERSHYLIKNMGEKEKHYIGQNVFGARVRVDDYTETKYFITPVNKSNIPTKFSVNSSTPNKIGVLFICKPARLSDDEGYIDWPGRSFAATYDIPSAHRKKFYSVGVTLHEIWIYDLVSGSIYLKHKIIRL